MESPPVAAVAQHKVRAEPSFDDIIARHQLRRPYIFGSRKGATKPLPESLLLRDGTTILVDATPPEHDPYVVGRSAGIDDRIVGKTSIGPTTLAIIVGAQSPLTSPKDLRGKKVAVTKGSDAHHLLPPPTIVAATLWSMILSHDPLWRIVAPRGGSVARRRFGQPRRAPGPYPPGRSPSIVSRGGLYTGSFCAVQQTMGRK